MANFFDQFDPPAAAQPNFFDQFDEPATPVAAAAPAAQPNAWTDVPSSFGSGIVRGAAETAMLPATMGRLGDAGVGFAMDKGEELIRHIFGMGPLTDEERSRRVHARDGRPNLSNAIYGGQDIVRTIMDDHLHKPETLPGKFAETVGEFVAPGGLPSKSVRAAPTIARKAGEYAADLTRTAVLPGLTSEAAGQVTAGTPFETPARVAGALAGNLGSAVLKSANAPETVLRRAAGPIDKIDWDRAIGLQNNTQGVRLTGPEAISQAQNGGSALPNVQRVVEGSIDGQAKMAPFFAARPAEVDSAVGDVLDAIAPQSATPSVLGPRAAEAASTVLDDVRQGINTQTRPLYQVAEPQIIPDAQFTPIAADPRFQSALARLRGNADLAPDYEAFPDNSIAVVDAVTKDMAARGEALANKANPLYGPELAGKNAAGATSARDIARDPARGGSADYDAALGQQAQQRRDVLQPLSEGPLGQVAAATDTAGAGNAILPQNPLVGSEHEIEDAVRRLVMQDADTTHGLVRQNLGDRYSKAATETQQGSAEFSGAKFHKDVAGNAQRDLTLQTVLEALSNPAAAQAMPELLDVLQATGRRKPIGSATEFNRSLNADLGTGPPQSRIFNLFKTAGASWLTNAGDGLKRASLRNSTASLADMFTDPQSVELIREALSRGAGISLPEAFVKAGVQSAPIVSGSEGR